MGMHSTKYGGLEKFLVFLAKELNKVNICLVAIYNSEPHSREFTEDLIKSGGKVIISHALHPFRYFFDFIKLFIRFKPILVHAHFQSYYSVVISRLLGTKQVFASLHIMITDTNSKYISDIKQLHYSTRIARFIFNKFADRIFTISDACKFQYISLFPEVGGKIERLYLGSISNQYPGSVSKEKYKFPSDKVIIGTISFNSPVKGLDILMDAIVILKNSFNCNHFMVVHVGIDLQAPENAIFISQSKQKGIDDKILWMGIRNDVAEILPGFDMYCQPSRSEALSLSITEAGMAGLPIVGSRVGGIPEVVLEGFNGILFEVGNSEQLAECLFKLIINPKLRKKMGNNSRKFMMSNFNIHKQVKTMCDKYLENHNVK
jgi:glycosyltransferase involved in cell wall biosynthesis